MTKAAAWLIGLLLPLAAHSQDGRLAMMTWNVENLFDTCRSATKDDAAFLPQGDRRWTQSRYRRKLSLIGRTIAASAPSPPDLVALCEVENDSVLSHLTRRSLLARLGYRYLMTHSPDRRGMNVALLYQPHRFRLIAHESLHIPFISGREKPTRDILHATGVLPSADTLDLFVCHWPSRSGGQQLTEAYRLRAARCLRRVADSLLRVRRRPAILCVGDFNDEPHNRSLRHLAGADGRYRLLSDTLRAPRGIEGTYYFRRRWHRLDHAVVNADLLCRPDGFRLAPTPCVIWAAPWLLTKNRALRWVPRRTYAGPHYQGGVSDHLPLIVHFVF